MSHDDGGGGGAAGGTGQGGRGGHTRGGRHRGDGQLAETRALPIAMAADEAAVTSRVIHGAHTRARGGGARRPRQKRPSQPQPRCLPTTATTTARITRASTTDGGAVMEGACSKMCVSTCIARDVARGFPSRPPGLVPLVISQRGCTFTGLAHRPERGVWVRRDCSSPPPFRAAENSRSPSRTVSSATPHRAASERTRDAAAAERARWAASASASR